MTATRLSAGAQVAVTIIATAMLAGCGFSPPLSAGDRATLETCRSDADRAYNAQNRGQLSERNGSDSPFSGGAQRASPSDGLADRYSHERVVSDCVRYGSSEPAGNPPAH